MNKMNSGIYCIENLVNGKMYIGQSTNIEGRISYHFSTLENNKHFNPHLQNSYNKYGKENFKFKTLLYCEPIPAELTCYEQFFVDSHDPEMLYNIRPECVDSNLGIEWSEETRAKMSQNHADVSGKNNPMYGKIGENHPFYGKHHSEETKEKISIANSGENCSKETRKKMSEATSGKNNPMYGIRGKDHPSHGKHLSDEAREKISKANSGKYKGEKNPNSKLAEKQVFEILDLYYNKKEMQKDILKKYDVSIATISSVCNGRTWKKCYKKFVETNPNCVNFYNEKCYNAKLTKKQVFEILDLYYNKKEKQADIAREYSVNNATVSLICLGKTWKSCYKEFIEVNSNYADFLNKNCSRLKLTEKQVFEILDLYYNEKETQKDIAEKYGVSRPTISYICRGKHWEFCYKEFMESQGR